MLTDQTSPVTHAIIGAAFEVHNHLGPGFLESAYGDAMELELAARQLNAEREVQVLVGYKGATLRTRYRADFVVDSNILLELKAQTKLTAIDEAQVIHYLRATGLEVALLINFGSKSCEVKRFVGNGYEDPISVEPV